jgi:flagellar motor switch protein FliM
VLYDFRRPASLARENVRTLQIAYETFARRYATLFTSSLRVASRVTLVSIEQLTYDEYVSGLTNPTLMALVHLDPLPGTAMLELPLATAMVSVDHLLGGPGGPQPQRPLSEIEAPLVRDLLGHLLRELCYALEPLVSVRATLGGIEYNPQFVQASAASDAVVVASFEMKVGSAEECVSTLCLPLSMILPRLHDDVGVALTDSQRRSREHAERDMAAGLQHVPVDVSVRFAPLSMRTDELVALRPGDVIRLDHPVSAPLEVRAADTTFGHAVAGNQGSRLACLVVAPAKEDLL